MAARSFTADTINSWTKNLTAIQFQFQINSAQTTDTNNFKIQNLLGMGIKNVANVATGVYKISLTDSFFKLLDFNYAISGPIGTPVAIASLVSGTPYVVSTVGTSAAADWVLGGLPAVFANVNANSSVGATTGAQVGMAFVGGAGASGAAGTGFAAPIITSGISMIQLYGSPSTTLNSTNVGQQAPYFFVQTLYTAAGPILAPAAPVDLTTIRMSLFVANSYIKGS